MLAKIKAFLAALPGFRRRPLAQFSNKTSQALRQLNNRYVRQKRLWVYIILSSVGLVVVYVMFSIFWAELWDHEVVVPAAWIILTGIGISIFQVRRCNDVIRTLRQAYTVQVQIEKAQAEKEAEEAKKQMVSENEAKSIEARPANNGPQKRPTDEPRAREEDER